MFSFLKSKKGFTLVELMIVVVIMAILVAVAVPIYSAITKNARKKTCIGNQREIISTLSSWLMLQEGTKIAGSFDITNTNGDNPAFAATQTAGPAGTEFTNEQYATVKSLFKTVPGCPMAGNVITVTIEQGAEETATSGEKKSSVSTSCSDSEGEHVVPGVIS